VRVEAVGEIALLVEVGLEFVDAPVALLEFVLERGDSLLAGHGGAPAMCS
jgi:hypothetical protein